MNKWVAKLMMRVVRVCSSYFKGATGLTCLSVVKEKWKQKQYNTVET